jgi:ABC-type polysaccharide transport system permease subunit
VNKAARLWAALAAPGAFWLLFFFAVPFYAVACVAFGSIDPIFRDAIPQWNPLNWSFGEFNAVFSSVTKWAITWSVHPHHCVCVSAMDHQFRHRFSGCVLLGSTCRQATHVALLLIMPRFG